MARKSTRAGEDALEQAQDLVYDAWEADSPKRRIALAKKALALSPLCADAYVLLATEAEPGSPDELDLWRRGLENGEKALGKDAFEEMAGHFWGFLETRPYMRARLGLARALWERGARDEAIDHLQAMLRLNPDDNQGIRYVLAAYLVDAERDAEFAALLENYPDEGGAEWTWTRALAAFRIGGDCEESRKRLREAMSDNAHVSAYLLGERRLPKTLPPFISPGGVDEAVHYAAELGFGWARSPGALDWLRAQTPSRGKSPSRSTPVAKRR